MSETITGPLSFGQLAVWRDIESMPPERHQDNNLVRTWAIPDGCTLTQVREALDQLVHRHEALRTVYNPADGVPEQVVHAPSPAPVRTFDLPMNRTNLGDLTDAVQPQLSEVADKPFDLTAEYSWRPMIFTAGQQPRVAAAVISHMASDHWSCSVLKSEFAALLADEPLTAPSTPHALATRQRSAQWKSRNDAVERYWSELTTALSPTVRETSQRYAPAATVQAQLVSGAAGLAARRLSSQLRVSTSSTVLAAYASAISSVLGVSRVLANVMFSNRFYPGTENLICPLNQWVPVLIESRPGEAFSNTVSRTHRAALRAYAHGCYDPDAFNRHWNVDPAVGEGSWPGFFFNFFPAKPGVDEIGELDTPPTFVAMEPRVRSGPGFYLVAVEQSELVLTSRVMWEGFSAPLLELVLRGINDTLVAAVA